MDGPENRVSLSPWFLPRRCCYSLRIYDDGSSSSSTVLFWWHADADAVQQLIMRQYVEWSGGVEPVEVGGGAGAALHGHGHVRNVQSRPLHDRHHCTVLCCSIIYSPSPGPLCCCPALPLHVLFLAVVRCGRCVQTYTSAIERVRSIHRRIAWFLLPVSSPHQARALCHGPPRTNVSACQIVIPIGSNRF